MLHRRRSLRRSFKTRPKQQLVSDDPLQLVKNRLPCYKDIHEPLHPQLFSSRAANLFSPLERDGNGTGRGTRDGGRSEVGGRGYCRAQNGSEWRVATGKTAASSEWRVANSKRL